VEGIIVKRLLFLVLMAGLCAAGCKPARVEKVVTVPPPPAQAGAPAQAESPAPTEAAPPAEATAGGVPVVKLTVKVAPELLSPRAAGRRGGRQNCPQTVLQQLFGVRFSRPHGCLVGGVEPGSLAEQAGLQAGDSITECNGEQVTCPASLLQRLPLGREPGLIELTIERNAGGKAS
jgi:membrane-associated protease RseP (regulator of RpoE activity)